MSCSSSFLSVILEMVFLKFEDSRSKGHKAVVNKGEGLLSNCTVQNRHRAPPAAVFSPNWPSSA